MDHSGERISWTRVVLPVYLCNGILHFLLHCCIHWRHDLDGHIDEPFRNDPANCLVTLQRQDIVHRVLQFLRTLAQQVLDQ